MRQLIEDLISMMEYHVEQTRPIHSTTVALQAAKEALKSLPPQRTEPVIDKSAAIRIATALGWTPPRTWVRLTDEEIDSINYTSAYMLAREVETKLKERNQ